MYSVRVLAHNEHGPGSSSPPIIIRTQAEVDLPSPPTSLSATPISAFSILVTWLPPPNPDGVEKYKLYYRRVNRIFIFIFLFPFLKIRHLTLLFPAVRAYIFRRIDSIPIYPPYTNHPPLFSPFIASGQSRWRGFSIIKPPLKHTG